MTMKVNGFLTMAGVLALCATLDAPAALAGSRTVERTGPNGATLDASRTRGFDSEQGVYTADRSRQLTGVNGKSLTSSRGVERTANGAVLNRQVTGSGGTSASAMRSVSRGDDSVTIDRQVTGPEGQTHSSTHSYARPDSP